MHASQYVPAPAPLTPDIVRDAAAYGYALAYRWVSEATLTDLYTAACVYEYGHAQPEYDDALVDIHAAHALVDSIYENWQQYDFAYVAAQWNSECDLAEDIWQAFDGGLVDGAAHAYWAKVCGL